MRTSKIFSYFSDYFLFCKIFFDNLITNIADEFFSIFNKIFRFTPYFRDINPRNFLYI